MPMNMELCFFLVVNTTMDDQTRLIDALKLRIVSLPFHINKEQLVVDPSKVYLYFLGHQDYYGLAAEILDTMTQVEVNDVADRLISQLNHLYYTFSPPLGHNGPGGLQFPTDRHPLGY